MSSRNPATPADAGQAEHLADITREVLAIAALVGRAGEQYGSDTPQPGHADSWRLDLDLIAAEKAMRQVRERNKHWRRAREVAVDDAAEGIDTELPNAVRPSMGVRIGEPVPAGARSEVDP
jgi:hypothetical protein